MHNLENILFFASLFVVIGAPLAWAVWMLWVLPARPSASKAQEWAPEDFWPGNWGKR